MPIKRAEIQPSELNVRSIQKFAKPLFMMSAIQITNTDFLDEFADMLMWATANFVIAYVALIFNRHHLKLIRSSSAARDKTEYSECVLTVITRYWNPEC